MVVRQRGSTTEEIVDLVLTSAYRNLGDYSQRTPWQNEIAQSFTSVADCAIDFLRGRDLNTRPSGYACYFGFRRSAD